MPVAVGAAAVGARLAHAARRCRGAALGRGCAPYELSSSAHCLPHRILSSSTHHLQRRSLGSSAANLPHRSTSSYAYHPTHRNLSSCAASLPHRSLSSCTTNLPHRSTSSSVYFLPHRSLSSSAADTLPYRIDTRGVPIYLYARPDDIEGDALEQLIKIAESGICDHHVAAMPDVHLGKGAAVGSVYASKSFVAPNGVGVDIGCGMAAVPVAGLWRDQLVRPDGTFVKEAAAVQRLLKQRIPTGPNSHSNPLPEAKHELGRISGEHPPSAWLRKIVSEHGRVAAQVGSLGGGNHFLEVLYDEAGQVWLMLHSGSRWVGNNTAEHYNKLAMQQMASDGRGERMQPNALNSLRIDSGPGELYLQDMAWCQAYALANRHAMLKIMMQVVQEVLGKHCEEDRAINTHHNFCQCEECTVRDPSSGAEVVEKLWITRKGATSARPGQPGLIPGSMGTGSFVVEGKGEPLAWSSCSHGAGRRLSRTKAFEVVGQKEFEAAMDGILCDKGAALRDEAPQAYKDLGTVMRQQESLVSVLHRLQPLINVKGVDKGSRQKKVGEARRAMKGRAAS